MSLIRNSNQVKQAIDFSGIQNGKIHPSDIDAVLEFDNDILILIEVKRKGNKIPTGQRLLLERVCDNWRTRKSVVLFVTHEFYDTTKDIPLNKCIVEKVYWSKSWRDNKNKDIVSLLNELGKYWKSDKLKL
jgi:hypothetical protein